MILLSNVLSICPEDLGSYLPSIPTQNQARGPDFLSKQSERKGKSLSHVELFATPWDAAHQVPLSMGFSRQGYWKIQRKAE